MSKEILGANVSHGISVAPPNIGVVIATVKLRPIELAVNELVDDEPLEINVIQIAIFVFTNDDGPTTTR
ncbi:hypothetical protein BGX26_001566 [Mortierella sp. AD094]|nr:hypothetical protein BGX26_001566 [Mortierella sp. AD094]